MVQTVAARAGALAALSLKQTSPARLALQFRFWIFKHDWWCPLGEDFG